MSESGIASGLASTYQQLLASLATLERAGEFAAAAHVVAAIDSIEERLDAARIAGSGEAESGVVRIAERMREAFGDAADAVARRQLMGSSGATLLAWAAIVARISDTVPSSA